MPSVVFRSLSLDVWIIEMGTFQMFSFDSCGALRSLQRDNLSHPHGAMWLRGFHDTILLLIVRKRPLLIHPCVGVLLVTHRWFLYLVFVFLLGAICTRESLRYDFLIAEKVNSCLFVSIPLTSERPSKQKGRGEGISHHGSVCWCGVARAGVGSDCMYKPFK